MECHINQQIETWIFEYMLHQYITCYFEDGWDVLHRSKRHANVLRVLTAYLNDEGKESISHREYICSLFLHLLCMEESLDKDESHADCDYFVTDDFSKLMTHAIAYASRDTKSEHIKKLARLSLIETHVVHYKYSFRTNTEKEALNEFQEFVNLMPLAECQEMYEMCAKMDCVEPEDDFISEYLDQIKDLVKSLYGEFDEPYLIKHARLKESNDTIKTQTLHLNDSRNSSSLSDITDSNDDGIAAEGHARLKESNDNTMKTETVQLNDSRNSSSLSDITDSNDDGIAAEGDDEGTDKITPELQALLQDSRPSKMSDLDEIKVEESSILRKIRIRAEAFDINKHLHQGIKLERQIKRKPPSHRAVRVGRWMPEEERKFIKMTLKIGIGNWSIIKSALKTFRSSQQLRDKWRNFKTTQIDEVRKEEKDLFGEGPSSKGDKSE